jgi:hypothetical protein
LYCNRCKDCIAICNQIKGKWFLNRFLIDYGNSYEFTVTRRVEKMMTFKGRIKEDVRNIEG